MHEQGRGLILGRVGGDIKGAPGRGVWYGGLGCPEEVGNMLVVVVVVFVIQRFSMGGKMVVVIRRWR